MSRPRIRSLKPDMWHDEKIGGLSREARLLFIGLITMADDEGRLRALPAAILGHVYPYDLDAARKITGWLEEIKARGLVHAYTIADVPYVSLVGWSKHQKINRPTPSDVPPPGGLTETSGSTSPVAPGANTKPSPPRAQAHAPADWDGIGRDGMGIPPSPPLGGKRPTPPVGNRKSDVAAYLADLEAWAPHLNGGIDEEVADVWKDGQARLRDALDESKVELYLSTLHPHRLDGETLVLGGSEQQISWAQERFSSVIVSALHGRPVDFVPCEATA